jgi:hypothetical protein
MLSTGSVAGLGCSSLFALQQSDGAGPEKHKFLTDSKMSMEEVFRFAFQSNYIPTMNHLAKMIGKDKFLEMLKKAASEAQAEKIRKVISRVSRNDLATFVSPFKHPQGMYKNTLTIEVVEETPDVCELKVTECLWAKAFRDAGAADIGFASICYADYAVAEAWNPKLKMIRDKTLMQGHACCNHRYVFDG